MTHTNSSYKPLFHGVILVAGGAVGAGMFALPLVSAGPWFVWSLATMVVVWWFTFLAAKLLAEVNFQFTENNSFDSIVSTILGPKWAALNNFSVAFIMYILMYAYITAGGGILDASLSEFVILPKLLLSLLFASIAAIIVCLNTTFVSRLSAVLMVGMGLSFMTANSALFAVVDVQALFTNSNVSYASYVAYAIPVYVTAFACAGLVPTLVSHYRLNVKQHNGRQTDSKKVIQSLLFGSLLTLLTYTVWLSLTLGNIERDSFVKVSQEGGGLNALVAILQTGMTNSYMQAALSWFSHLAISTSFLSISVGLVHFLQDRFHLGQDRLGRMKAVLIAFVPPTMCSLFWAYGFVGAIGYAGLLVAFSFFIVPALLSAKTEVHQHTFQWLSVLMFGLIVIVLKLASLASVLPVFPVSQ